MKQRRKRAGRRVSKRPRRGLRPAFSLPRFTITSVAVATEVTDWGEQMLQVPRAWELCQGDGILVGVIDTGMAIQHPDLKDAIADSRDFTGSATGVGDDVGHGTHVAGIIAGAQNGQGVVGVAPHARLLNAKALGTVDRPGDEATVAAAIRWCTQQGANLINLSLASTSEVPEVRRAIQEAVAAGVHVICAAGNTGPTPDAVGFPARYDETIAVGYVRRNAGRLLAGFDTGRGTQVDLTAPGGAILSTFPPNVYALASGTSMAAPFVSGVAALLLSHRKAKGLKPLTGTDRLIRFLTRGATDLFLSGRDDLSGLGLINPLEVLRHAEEDA